MFTHSYFTGIDVDRYSQSTKAIFICNTKIFLSQTVASYLGFNILGTEGIVSILKTPSQTI